MFPESGLSNLAAVALTTVATLASAAGAPLPSQSAFFLSRSENRNQVHCALRLDEACRPVGTRPVQVYWRMLERGASEVEELLEVEQPVSPPRGSAASARSGRGRSWATASAGWSTSS